jgi:hypothetical protein
MQPREEEKREPQMAPEPRREEQPKPRRFRIVKLEERIAPLTSGPGYVGNSVPSRIGCTR